MPIDLSVHDSVELAGVPLICCGKKRNHAEQKPIRRVRAGTGHWVRVRTRITWFPLNPENPRLLEGTGRTRKRVGRVIDRYNEFSYRSSSCGRADGGYSSVCSSEWNSNAEFPSREIAKCLFSRNLRYRYTTVLDAARITRRATNPSQCRRTLWIFVNWSTLCFGTSYLK